MTNCMPATGENGKNDRSTPFEIKGKPAAMKKEQVHKINLKVSSSVSGVVPASKIEFDKAKHANH